MDLINDALTRRAFLAQAATGLAADSKRIIIDTHLEVWTIDPQFPFRHPEHPDAKPEISAPIENEVEVMSDYGLRYAVLINPRYYGWDNSYISYSLHKYPDRFVAHGLINPEDPKVVERLRYWIKEHGFQGQCSKIWRDGSRASKSSWITSVSRTSGVPTRGRTSGRCSD